MKNNTTHINAKQENINTYGKHDRQTEQNYTQRQNACKRQTDRTNVKKHNIHNEIRYHYKLQKSIAKEIKKELTKYTKKYLPTERMKYTTT